MFFFLHRMAACSAPRVRQSMERRPAPSPKAKWKFTASPSHCQAIQTVARSRLSTAYRPAYRYLCTLCYHSDNIKYEPENGMLGQVCHTVTRPSTYFEFKLNQAHIFNLHLHFSSVLFFYFLPVLQNPIYKIWLFSIVIYHRHRRYSNNLASGSKVIWV